jgi:hypothetical protein
MVRRSLWTSLLAPMLLATPDGDRGSATVRGKKFQDRRVLQESGRRVGCGTRLGQGAGEPA